MKFKVGDRVRELGRECYKNENIIIIEYHETTSGIFRYHVKYLNILNVSGNNMLYWVAENELELDKEYYRDKNLIELGI